ncbi:MAG: hypothetical protein FK733_00335 [Asgard group archaeon]|nr:hypothetical protein [Asgard group archaeon]
MKLSKILKNRKAMTPVMIGVIIAASVLAVFFVVMAATVPLMRSEVQMHVFDATIKGNDTWAKSLKFLIVCDNDGGVLDKVEIYKGGTLWGDRNLNIEFTKSETKFLGIDTFNPSSAAQAALEVNATDLLFLEDVTYTLRIYYSNLDGVQQPTIDYSFVYEKPD